MENKKGIETGAERVTERPAGNVCGYHERSGDMCDCVICSENKISSNLHCYECNKNICINCCNNLSSRTSLLFVEKKQIFIKYQCPFCRYTNNKHIRLFNKNEIISIYYDNVSQLSLSHNYNKVLSNMYNELYNENIKLREELINKTEYINELEKKSDASLLLR